MALVIGIIVFAILIALDIVGHKKRLVRRKASDWGLLCFFCAGAALCIFFSVKNLIPESDPASMGKYLAYRYLMEGDSRNALAAAASDDEMPDISKDYIRMLSDAVDGDYKSMYFESDKLMPEMQKFDPDLKSIIEELNDAAMKAINDGTDPSAKIAELIEKSYAETGIEETDLLREYFELDQAVRLGEADPSMGARVTALRSSFPGNTSVQKLAISYYTQIGDFTTAIACASELTDTCDSAENRIIYSDVFAQSGYAFTEDRLRGSDDAEIISLVEKSDRAAEKAAKYEEGSDNAVKYTEQSKQYLDSAADVYYERVKNYIKVKTPFTGDNNGLYDLQLIKMKVLEGDAEQAYADLSDLLEKAGTLSSSSPVKKDLLTLSYDIGLYKASPDEELKALIFDDCENLIISQSQDVVPAGMDSINRKAAVYLASYIVYDVNVFEVTDIDISSYPQVKVSVNTNRKKANIIGGGGEFYADDFVLGEDGRDVDSFAMTANLKNKGRNVAVVLDISGGGDDRLTEVQSVLKTLKYSGTATRTAIVDGNAETRSSLSDTSERYFAAVRDLTLDNPAADIKKLNNAVSLLNEAEAGDKVIILITDGLDMNEKQQSLIAGTLRQDNVLCYIIALQGTDMAVAGNIASAGGGLAEEIVRCEEMNALMDQYRDVLNNLYVFTYTAEDVAGKHTVKVDLLDGGMSASGTYVKEAVS
ncbi:MAG: VWA domain-containing protein [Lachnospiraceae bacterium]|nr:VWA domain-containing protein [Lachnospiraceae bacterium]